MNFDAQSLSVHLASILSDESGGQDRPGARLLVAFSGGLDSSVLLHAMQQIRPQFPAFILEAIHVNHGLSPNANTWQSFCENTCAALGIALHVETVLVNRAEGSLENAAREARYQAFERHLKQGDRLLLAHHADDQAETFLLRTLRGAGPRGLAAMPVSRALGNGVLLRPLLPFSRETMAQWARAQQLSWVDDESNLSARHDRNFCRLEVLPRLAERWPGYRQSWQRSAELCADADVLLEELAAQDFARVRTNDPDIIAGDGLTTLSEARQRNLLRYWLRIRGTPEPGWNILTRMVSEVLSASAGAQPELRWGTDQDITLLTRNNGNLCLRRRGVAQPKRLTQSWRPPDQIQLQGNGVLHAVRAEQGLRIREGDVLTLRYRQGGEVCCLAGRRTRSLKKILQESGMNPWQRSQLPLVYAGDALVYVPGLGVCEGWQARDKEPAWEIVWTS